MTTYDLTSTTPNSIQTGDIIDCPYSGTYKQITLPKGQYKLEVWGAQGGPLSSYVGGKGGYSAGILNLKEQITVYLYSGGIGNNTQTGGFNGGGNVINSTSNSSYQATGGGGSDIRIGQDSLYARVIVAGGGGAATNYSNSNGGDGGGLEGLVSSGNTSSNHRGTGGTQTSGGSYTTLGSPTYTVGAGSFGQGGYGNGSGASGWPSAGGGGGWYGGGGGTAAGGAGGSGYVYTSSTASNYPSGCLLDSSMYLSEAETKAGNIAFTSPTGASETGHTGNGYIRITVILAESSKMATYMKINNEWVEIG